MGLTFDVSRLYAPLNTKICDFCGLSVLARLKVYFHKIELKAVAVTQPPGFEIAFLCFFKILKRGVPITVNACQSSPAGCLSRDVVNLLKKFERHFCFAECVFPSADETIQFGHLEMRVAAVLEVSRLLCDFNRLLEYR